MQKDNMVQKYWREHFSYVNVSGHIQVNSGPGVSVRDGYIVQH